MSNKIQSHLPSKSLAQWLSYLENLHHSEIDLGLARISQVADKLGVDLSASKVITVAGTNGKGTTCAFIENALLSLGHTVAVYSSPHIEQFNERLRINRLNITDQPLVEAFIKIEQARGDTSLTYYEYTTLAAFLILQQQKPQVIILEVGLGGRLDATNMIDADIAVITAIDLDHQQFLGDTREAIGFEKAGIFRQGKKVVVGDPNPPKTVIDHAKSLQALSHYRGEHFHIEHSKMLWQWQFSDSLLTELQQPHIPLDNVATALAVLKLLGIALKTSFVNQVIEQTKVPGRTELFYQGCDIMLDVGHNPHAARYLASTISACHYRKVFAVFSMLADKDISAVVSVLSPVVSHWFIGQLDVERGAHNERIAADLTDKKLAFDCFDNIPLAYKMAVEQAQQDDLILVFGSFFTVASIRRLLV